MRLPLLAALLAGLLCDAACAHSDAEPPAPLPAPLPASAPVPLRREEREIVDAINEFRARKGLRALRVDPALCRAASAHAQNIARQGRLEHVLDGRRHVDRAAAVGFHGPVAENIAAGSGTSPRRYVELWIESAAHRANLLVFRSGILGIGFADSPAGDHQYLALLIGKTP